jgi:nucleotide-binding universal stress UspA family protein
VNTIVVGYDGSEHAERALDRGIGLAREGAALIIVSAAKLSPADPTFVPTVGSTEPGEIEEARTSLDTALARTQKEGINARTIEAHGDPADMLVQVAKDEGADLIVVGTRGLSFAQRTLLGSVSTKVVHHAHCDVLVVR